MDDEQLVRSEIEFAVADAVWRKELVLVFGYGVDEDELSSIQRKGEVGSTLRAAFDDMKRSLQAFRAARGTA